MSKNQRLPQSRQQQFRSRCSIARTLEVVGDKWTLLVLRDVLWHQKNTFKALRESEERIPSNILTERLRRLEAWGLIYKELYQAHPARYFYYATEEGRSLQPALLAIMQWGHERLGGGLYDPHKD